MDFNNFAGRYYNLKEVFGAWISEYVFTNLVSLVCFKDIR